ncbi:hypothetical protein EU538_02225 [Candidatus Thorarchaeota archaeon]|nr:MAG: hypothetical protein EU538_02225 [Candidatus Thorarchaeota archaeon]
MSDEPKKKPISTELGLIVKTDVETLRKAVEKVLFEYVEFSEDSEGRIRSCVGDLVCGEALIFREDMDFLPAEIVAINLDEDLWFVMSTSEIPENGFPTTKDAVRVAESEKKKLRILEEFFTKEAGLEVENLDELRTDDREDAQNLLKIVKDAAKRYHH